MQQTMLTDGFGYVAAGLVFATFCAQRMASLRALAIVSNVAFIGYGLLAGLWPILILHSAMLPMNIQRYRQTVRGHCGTTTADAGMPGTCARRSSTSRMRSVARGDALGARAAAELNAPTDVVGQLSALYPLGPVGKPAGLFHIKSPAVG
jgi:hypothetical protein